MLMMIDDGLVVREQLLEILAGVTVVGHRWIDCELGTAPLNCCSGTTGLSPILPLHSIEFSNHSSFRQILPFSRCSYSSEPREKKKTTHCSYLIDAH